MTIISHRHKFIFIKPRKVAGSSVQIALAPWCGEDDVLSDGGLRFRPDVDTDEFRAPPVQHADASGVYGYVAQHALPDVVRAKVGPQVWEEYFKFTIVRNPWDLFVSMYHHDLAVILPELRAWVRTRLRDVLSHPGRTFRRLGLVLGPERKRAWQTGRLHRLRVSVPELFWCTRLRRGLVAGRRKESVEFALRHVCFARHIAEIPQFYICGGRAYADYVMGFETLQQDFDAVCRRLHLPSRPLPRTKSRVRPRSDDYRTYYNAYSRAFLDRMCRHVIATFDYRFDGDQSCIPDSDAAPRGSPVAERRRYILD